MFSEPVIEIQGCTARIGCGELIEETTLLANFALSTSTSATVRA